MNVKKGINFMILIGLLMLLSGCQSTPESIEDVGVTRAMTDVEQQVAQQMRQQPQIESEDPPIPAQGDKFAPVCADNGRVLDTTLDEGGAYPLRIQATVSVPEVQSVCTYTFQNQPMDDAMMKTAFFGEDAQTARSMDVVDPATEEKVWRVDMPGGAYKELWKNREGFTAMEYSFSDGKKRRDVFESDDPNTVYMPIEQAVTQLSALAEALNLYGITVENYFQEAQRLTIYFYPNFTPFDVAPCRDQNNLKTAYAMAAFSENAMTGMLLNAYLVLEEEKPLTHVLTLDDALTIAAGHLGNTLKPYKDSVFTRISLRMRYLQDRKKGVFTATPVWYFAIDNPSEIREDAIYEDQPRAYTSAFIIDAQSGAVHETQTIIR